MQDIVTSFQLNNVEGMDYPIHNCACQSSDYLKNIRLKLN
jgi:hypothetical protein